MAVTLLTGPTPWHEIMDCVLSLCVGVATADVVSPEKRNLMKPVTGDTVIAGQIDHSEVEAVRELFGTLCADPALIATVNEKSAAYANSNRHPGPVCKYLAVACTHQQKLALITALIRVAEADGEPNAREIWFIERTAFVVELPEDMMPELRRGGAAPGPSEYLGERLAHHCRLLGVQPPVDVQGLKRAYRAAAMKAHPDTVGSTDKTSWEDANNKFIEVRQAYETLLAAAEAGALGEPPTTLTRVALDSLDGAAITLWSGFSKKTWSTPAKSLDELRADEEARDARAGGLDAARTMTSDRATGPIASATSSSTGRESSSTGPRGEASPAVGWFDPESKSFGAVIMISVLFVNQAKNRAEAMGIVVGVVFALALLYVIGAAISGAIQAATSSPSTDGPLAAGNACGRCKTTLPPDGQFCPRCGASKVPVCSQCHIALPADARFCSKCGAPVTSASSDESSTPVAAATLPTQIPTPDGPPIKCMACSEESPAGSTWCRKCGRLFTMGGSAARGSPPDSSQRDPQAAGLSSWITPKSIVILAVITGLAFVCDRIYSSWGLWPATEDSEHRVSFCPPEGFKLVGRLPGMASNDLLLLMYNREGLRHGIRPHVLSITDRGPSTVRALEDGIAKSIEDQSKHGWRLVRSEKVTLSGRSWHETFLTTEKDFDGEVNGQLTFHTLIENRALFITITGYPRLIEDNFGVLRRSVASLMMLSEPATWKAIPVPPAKHTVSAAIKARLKHAAELESEKKWEEAELEYRAIIKADPLCAAAHNLLGDILYDKRHERDAAEVEYRAAIDADPDDALGHWNLGVAHYNRKDFTGATKELQRVLAIDPRHANAHCYVGDILYMQEHRADAVQEWRTTLEIDPRHVMAHVNLGVYYMDEREYEKAEGYLRLAISYEPGGWTKHRLLAKVLKAQGKYKEAEQEESTANGTSSGN